jgi:hypothetical protein
VTFENLQNEKNTGIFVVTGQGNFVFLTQRVVGMTTNISALFCNTR